jgi:hypothetical protein
MLWPRDRFLLVPKSQQERLVRVGVGTISANLRIAELKKNWEKRQQMRNKHCIDPTNETGVVFLSVLHFLCLSLVIIVLPVQAQPFLSSRLWV